MRYTILILTGLYFLIGLVNGIAGLIAGNISFGAPAILLLLATGAGFVLTLLRARRFNRGTLALLFVPLILVTPFFVGRGVVYASPFPFSLPIWAALEIDLSKPPVQIGFDVVPLVLLMMNWYFRGADTAEGDAAVTRELGARTVDSLIQSLSTLGCAVVGSLAGRVFHSTGAGIVGAAVGLFVGLVFSGMVVLSRRKRREVSAARAREVHE